MNCPKCGSSNAYVGLTEIDCPNPKCGSYKTPAPVSPEDICRAELDRFTFPTRPVIPYAGKTANTVQERAKDLEEDPSYCGEDLEEDLCGVCLRVQCIPECDSGDLIDSQVQEFSLTRMTRSELDLALRSPDLLPELKDLATEQRALRGGDRSWYAFCYCPECTIPGSYAILGRILL